MIKINALLVLLTVNIVPFVSSTSCQVDKGNNKLVFKYEDSVRLHIFKTKNKYETLEIKGCHSKSLTLNSFCNPNSKIKLIVHGFMERWRMETRWDWVDDLKNEFFNLSDSNELCIIAVDWKELATGGVIPNYWKAISNMKIAGELIANVLNNSNIDIKKTHCIGFSLGVHMCSMMYKIYFKKFNVKPFRLTALDPAGPFFKDKSDQERISINDADLVDVINTSADFGLYENSGHYNFYTNTRNGKEDTCKDIRIRDKETDEKVILYEEDDLGNSTSSYQTVDFQDLPLGNSVNSTLTKRSIKSVLSNFYKNVKTLPQRVFIQTHQFFGCGHLMSVRFFIYSINYCEYKSEICETTVKNCKSTEGVDYPRMGYHTDKSDEKYRLSSNVFYVNTTFKVPFCRDIHLQMLDKVNNYNQKLCK